MLRPPKRLMSQIAATTALLTLVLSFALPLLDVDSTAGAAFEADHENGCFIASHDHSICNQFGNQGLSAGNPRPAVRPPFVTVYEVPEPTPRLATALVERPGHPRAPPVL